MVKVSFYESGYKCTKRKQTNNVPAITACSVLLYRLDLSSLGLKMSSDLKVDMKQEIAADHGGVSEGNIKSEPEEEHSHTSACENIDDEETLIKEELEIGPTVLQRRFLPSPGLHGANAHEQHRCDPTSRYSNRSSLEQKSECDGEFRLTSVHSNKLKKNTTYLNEYANRKLSDYQTLIASSPPTNLDLVRYKHQKTSKIHLNRDKSEHTGEKSFSGDLCDAKFKECGHLITHKRIHTGEKPYCCDVCDAKFSQSGNLKTHKRIHTGEKPFCCDQCTAKFNRFNYLIAHKCKHTSEKLFSCDLCTAKYNRFHDLIVHKRKHTGEKPFSCDLCDAKFSRRHLNGHKRIHRRKNLP